MSETSRAAARGDAGGIAMTIRQASACQANAARLRTAGFLSLRRFCKSLSQRLSSSARTMRIRTLAAIRSAFARRRLDPGDGCAEATVAIRKTKVAQTANLSKQANKLNRVGKGVFVIAGLGDFDARAFAQESLVCCDWGIAFYVSATRMPRVKLVLENKRRPTLPSQAPKVFVVSALLSWPSLNPATRRRVSRPVREFRWA